MKKNKPFLTVIRLAILMVVILQTVVCSVSATENLEDLDRQIKGLEGRRLSIEEMQKATNHLADRYREMGYPDEHELIQNLKNNWLSLEEERGQINASLDNLYLKKYEAEEMEKRFIGEFKLTAYCPCGSCSGGFGFQTAIGVRAVEGVTIAVDPNIIPYYTKVYIDGVGHRVAQDCGGAVKQNRIDIFVGNHKDCFLSQYNRSSVKVWRAE